MESSSSGRAAAAEVLGTFLLVFFGLGAVHVAVLRGDLSGLWQIAVVWGVAIMVAIYSVGAISGAHINPAITVALAQCGLFPWRRVPMYISSQLAGAALAAAVLLLLFQPDLRAKEQALGVERGEPGSVATAMCYGEYYPSPGGLAASDGPLAAESYQRWLQNASFLRAFGAEVLGTAILAFVVVAVTSVRNAVSPGFLAPVFIGLTVAALICVLAPLTQACFNPARDLGPRLVALIGGWGSVAIPGPNGWSFLGVYVLAPVLGAVLGAGLHQRFVAPGYAAIERPADSTEAIIEEHVPEPLGAAD